MNKLYSKNSFNSYNLFFTLNVISQEDCYYYQFTETKELELFLQTLVAYGILHICSDGRIILTSSGEKLLQFLFFDVEIAKNPSKLYKIKL